VSSACNNSKEKKRKIKNNAVKDKEGTREIM
jgi:hypothetical protein